MRVPKPAGMSISLVFVLLASASAGGPKIPATSWLATAGGVGGVAFARAVATDGEGGALVVGAYRGAATFGKGQATERTLASLSALEDGFLARYDASGELLWVRGVEGSVYASLYDGVLDRQGGVYVAGSFEGMATFGLDDPMPVALVATGASADAFLARYDADGSLDWVVPIASPGYDLATSLALAEDEAVIVGGTFEDDLSLGVDVLEASGDLSAFLIAYELDGTLSWAWASLGAPGSEAAIWAIDARDDDEIFAGGDFLGTVAFGPGQPLVTAAGMRDVFVLEVGEDGDLDWATTLGGPDEDLLNGLGATKDGGVWGGGSFRGTVPYTLKKKPESLVAAGITDGFLASWDKRGSLREITRLGGIGQDRVEDVAAMPDNGVVAVGFFQGSADLSGDSKKPWPLDAAGATDAFVARYKKSAKLDWALRLGGMGFDGAVGVDATRKGEVVWGGYLQGATTLEGEPGPAGAGVFDAFAAALGR